MSFKKFPTVINGEEEGIRCTDIKCCVLIPEGEKYKLGPDGPLCIPCAQCTEFSIKRETLRQQKV